MNKVAKVIILGSAVSLLSTACATKDYVQQQLKPVKEKVQELDKRLTKVENELANLKKDVKANKDKIASLEKEHKAIKEKLDQLENATKHAYGRAEVANRKADKNAEDIRMLEDEIKKLSENVQRAIEKGLRK